MKLFSGTAGIAVDLLGARHDSAEDVDLVHEAGHDGRLARHLAGRAPGRSACTLARPSLFDWKRAWAVTSTSRPSE